MEKVYETLKKCGVYYLATVEGDTPHVRPFGALALYVRMALALLASLAVGLVAKMMALLVGRATKLQEENDLTI